MSSMHICLSGQAYSLSSEKTEFNPWSSLAIQTSLITKPLVPITPSLQSHKIMAFRNDTCHWLWTSQIHTNLHAKNCHIDIYVLCICIYICMQINTHKNCQSYQKQYSFIVSVLVRCIFISGKLWHSRESFEALGLLCSSLASLMMGYRILSS